MKLVVFFSCMLVLALCVEHTYKEFLREIDALGLIDLPQEYQLVRTTNNVPDGSYDPAIWGKRYLNDLVQKETVVYQNHATYGVTLNIDGHECDITFHQEVKTTGWFLGPHIPQVWLRITNDGCGIGTNTTLKFLPFFSIN